MEINRTGRSLYRLVLISALSVYHCSVFAHEFWLETAQPKPDSELHGTFYNGEGFRGDPVAQQALTTRQFFVYNDIEAKRTPITQQSTPTTIQVLPQLSPGLSVITYQSTDALHRYENFQEFTFFARAEGLQWAIDSHRDRQLPESYFSEIVKRYSKTLVCQDHATGSDQTLGLDLELTLKFNPFNSLDNQAPDKGIDKTDDESEWKVQLSSTRHKVQGRQVTLFHRNPDNRVTQHRLRTDRSGIATIPELGAGDYLLNTVTLRAPSLRDSFRYGAVWESSWSSLTFSYGTDCYPGAGMKVSRAGGAGNP